MTRRPPRSPLFPYPPLFRSNSAYYYAMLTPGNGINVQYRSSTGAAAQWPASLAGTQPAYLQVGRVGSTFTAYTSNDGVTWTTSPEPTSELQLRSAIVYRLLL